MRLLNFRNKFCENGSYNVQATTDTSYTQSFSNRESESENLQEENYNIEHCSDRQIRGHQLEHKRPLCFLPGVVSDILLKQNKYIKSDYQDQLAKTLW
jgi:hypothetical protein